jgi:hypothetical protein
MFIYTIFSSIRGEISKKGRESEIKITKYNKKIFIIFQG